MILTLLTLISECNKIYRKSNSDSSNNFWISNIRLRFAFERKKIITFFNYSNEQNSSIRVLHSFKIQYPSHPIPISTTVNLFIVCLLLHRNWNMRIYMGIWMRCWLLWLLKYRCRFKRIFARRIREYRTIKNIQKSSSKLYRTSL